MQYDQTLKCLIRDVVIADPALGPVHVLKADVSDSFLLHWLTPYRCSQAGASFPIRGRGLGFSSDTANRPYGMENSPLILCTTTETVTDLENATLRCNTLGLPHRLDDMTEAFFRKEPPTLHMALAGLTRDSYLR